MLPKPRSVWGSLLGVCMQLTLQMCRCPAKNSKQKLAGNAAKTPNIVTEISVFTQKFPAMISEI